MKAAWTAAAEEQLCTSLALLTPLNVTPAEIPHTYHLVHSVAELRCRIYHREVCPENTRKRGLEKQVGKRPRLLTGDLVALALGANSGHTTIEARVAPTFPRNHRVPAAKLTCVDNYYRSHTVLR